MRSAAPVRSNASRIVMSSHIGHRHCRYACTALRALVRYSATHGKVGLRMSSIRAEHAHHPNLHQRAQCDRPCRSQSSANVWHSMRFEAFLRRTHLRVDAHALAQEAADLREKGIEPSVPKPECVPIGKYSHMHQPGEYSYVHQPG